MPPSSMGRGWGRIRKKILERDPFCVLGTDGNGKRVKPYCTIHSTQVDHIVPRSVVLDNTPENLRGVCATCHAKRSQYPRNSRNWSPNT